LAAASVIAVKNLYIYSRCQSSVAR